MNSGIRSEVNSSDFCFHVPGKSALNGGYISELAAGFYWLPTVNVPK